VRFLIAIEPEISKRKEREELLVGFGSTVSHQLKNMLNTTGLLASLLQTSDHLDEQEHRYAEMILKSNQDMAAFISDLMELSRSQETSTDALEPFDLRGKIERIVSSQRNLHPHISFDVEYPDRPVLLRASRSLAYQVFINVIANAAEYSNPADGRVSIRISAANGQFIFTCADNGIGIPAEDQPKIFTQFFRASNAQGHKKGGTGLGLAIVKMICDKVGWSVSFTSSPGLGTAFTIVGACATGAPGKA
jgi:signal transduction histidine kinase